MVNAYLTAQFLNKHHILITSHETYGSNSVLMDNSNIGSFPP